MNFTYSLLWLNFTHKKKTLYGHFPKKLRWDYFFIMLHWTHLFTFNCQKKFFFSFASTVKTETNVIMWCYDCATCASTLFFLSHNGFHDKVWRLKKITPFDSCLLDKNWLLWNILKKCGVNGIYPTPREKTFSSFNKNNQHNLLHNFSHPFICKIFHQ